MVFFCRGLGSAQLEEFGSALAKNARISGRVYFMCRKKKFPNKIRKNAILLLTGFQFPQNVRGFTLTFENHGNMEKVGAIVFALT